MFTRFPWRAAALPPQELQPALGQGSCPAKQRRAGPQGYRCPTLVSPLGCLTLWILTVAAANRPVNSPLHPPPCSTPHFLWPCHATAGVDEPPVRLVLLQGGWRVAPGAGEPAAGDWPGALAGYLVSLLPRRGHKVQAGIKEGFVRLSPTSQTLGPEMSNKMLSVAEVFNPAPASASITPRGAVKACPDHFVVHSAVFLPLAIWRERNPPSDRLSLL